MLKQVLVGGIIAGAVAGVCAAALQIAFVVPSVLEGEVYETGSRMHFSADGVAQSARSAPGLGADWSRHALTLAFDLVTFCGFGLMMAALMGLARRLETSLDTALDTALDWRRGLVWGLAGFVAVHLAPAAGLPPELPGTAGADLGSRQIWWIATVAMTVLGSGLIAFGRGYLALLGGLAILAPHILGAPDLDTYTGVAPPELAARFVALSLATAAVAWAVLGATAGALMGRADP